MRLHSTETIVKRCGGSRIESDGRTSCSFGTQCTEYKYNGNPFYANHYLECYVEIRRYLENMELEAIKQAIEKGKSFDFLMTLRDRGREKVRDAIGRLNWSPETRH